MPKLGVNIDHVATLRQARYRGHDGAGEPDPVRAAHEAELGGADGITVHLREDRRHMQDRDLRLLAELVRTKLNLEMAATEAMVELACASGAHTAMLVPEGRDEVTTEGGLDVAGQLAPLTAVCARLKAAGLMVSAFIDAEARQISAAAEAGFDVCEVHTGPYAHMFALTGGEFRDERLAGEFERVAEAGRQVSGAGMRFNAGHALNFVNVGPIAALPGIEELHIGHSIVSRAVFSGLRGAVGEMVVAMGRGKPPY
ncbi:MAG: pyridoxine 5'-phosphate synthase [Planctomycetota bacterium]